MIHNSWDFWMNHDFHDEPKGTPWIMIIPYIHPRVPHELRIHWVMGIVSAKDMWPETSWPWTPASARLRKPGLWAWLSSRPPRNGGAKGWMVHPIRKPSQIIPLTEPNIYCICMIYVYIYIFISWDRLGWLNGHPFHHTFQISWRIICRICRNGRIYSTFFWWNAMNSFQGFPNYGHYVCIYTRNAWALPRRLLEVSHSQTNANIAATLNSYGKNT